MLLITILVFLLILTILVLIHEAGHYFMAKKFGIKVEEFGFGFPPRAFGIKRGETIYSINWLPIGGFVKLYGEDEAGAGKITNPKAKTTTIKDKDRAFFAKSPWQRATVVIAGVVMNAVLAAVIFYIFLGISGFKTELPLLTDHKFLGVNQQNTRDVLIGTVVKNSPAENIGLTSLSKILSVNGQPIADTQAFIDTINASKGKEVSLTWKNMQTNQTHTAEVTPRENPPKDEGALGVSLFALDTAVLSYETPIQKIFSGIVHPVNLMVYNFDVMGQLVKVSFENKSAEPLSQGVSGPVGIASVTGSILEIPNAKEKILQLLNLAGILSISLAFFNILPIPALDGGRLFFILIEAVTRKKINQRFETLAHTIGMAVLLGLIALITVQDIQKIVVGFFSVAK